MSYQAQAALEADFYFQQRSRAAAIQQAGIYKDDQRPAWVAVSNALLKEQPGLALAFTRLDAAGPGIGDKVDNGDGTIDQAKVTDDDLLSLTQANYPVVADLYFNEDGTPVEP
jgi:hypothetical protein